MRTVLFALAATAVLGLATAASPASALPVGPLQIATDAGSVVQARMTRRQMMRQRMMRRRMMRRRSMRGGDPNAINPSRPPAAQNLGQTTGGPRR